MLRGCGSRQSFRRSKLFKKLVPVTKDSHKAFKIKPVNDFDFAANVHLASLMAHEFVRAASVYPIVFIEDGSDGFRPVALMGLVPDQNLFVDDDGKWKASYIPAIIRRYPFALAKLGDAEQYTVCLDEESSLFSEKGDGKPLFDKEGKPSEVIENVKKYLTELQQMDQFTTRFCSFLKEQNMFTPMNMRVVDQDQLKNITGCYVVNEERLNNLSDQSFLDVKQKNFLPVIYAHLVSLSQVERLSMLKSERSAEGVQGEDDSSVH